MVSEVMKKLKDETAEKIFGISFSQAIKSQVCIDCKEIQCPEEMDPFDSREYNQSALCPDCWEAIMDVGRHDSEPTE